MIKCLSSTNHLVEKFGWYPPAEAKIHFSAMLAAVKCQHDNFSQDLCGRFQFEGCAIGSSGRVLLSSLLRLLHERDSGHRNEVLIPGYTCYSVAASVVRAGLKISVYDLDPSTLHPDMDSVRGAAGNKTLAVISQHLFGVPTPLSDLAVIAKKTGAYLIEDAAQALGGSINGMALGLQGDFGLYSFGRGKPLPVGAGGALVGKNKNVLATIAENTTRGGYLNLISTALSRIISNPAFYWLPEKLPLGLGTTVFDPTFPILPIPDTVAKLILTAAPFLSSFNTHRRNIAAVYSSTLNTKCLLPVPHEAEPVFVRFPVIAGNLTLARDLTRLGVRRMYPEAISKEKTIKPFFIDNLGPTPGAVEIAANLIVLPTHSGIHSELAQYIASIVKRQYHC